jgi:hypothetical protein
MDHVHMHVGLFDGQCCTFGYELFSRDVAHVLIEEQDTGVASLVLYANK